MCVLVGNLIPHDQGHDRDSPLVNCPTGPTAAYNKRITCNDPSEPVLGDPLEQRTVRAVS